MGDRTFMHPDRAQGALLQQPDRAQGALLHVRGPRIRLLGIRTRHLPANGGPVKRGGSRPISRVLSWTAIPLGPASPQDSSSQPGNDAGHVIVPLFGLAPGGVCRAGLLPDSRCALTAPFHPCHACLATPFGGLLSVALSVGSRRPGVTWHPALWSPDFPRRANATRLPGRLPRTVYRGEGRGARIRAFFRTSSRRNSARHPGAGRDPLGFCQPRPSPRTAACAAPP